MVDLASDFHSISVDDQYILLLYERTDLNSTE